MKDIKKYQGVIPAFYACYDAEGNISVAVSYTHLTLPTKA